MSTRILFLVLASGAAISLHAAENKPVKLDFSKLPPVASGPVDFARDIQPLFAAKCFSCHGAEKQKGGLRLDLKAGALEGGDNGKVFIPGKSAESKLVHALAGLGESGIMPPKEQPLTPAEIGKVRAWIDAGASWPDDGKVAVKKSDHWAYQQVKRPALPPIGSRQSAIGNPIDTFIRARLAKEKLPPSPEAERPTLIRRLSLDLLGLPPMPEESTRL
jgi:mono/diheme cytochrome c family protein